MSKKKEIKAFKEGIEAGVKPLKKKFDEISEMQGESLRVSSEIRRAQRKGQRLTNDLRDVSRTKHYGDARKPPSLKKQSKPLQN